jgi:hypothetical protein
MTRFMMSIMSVYLLEEAALRLLEQPLRWEDWAGAASMLAMLVVCPE